MRPLTVLLVVFGGALVRPAAAAPPAGWETWVPASATAVLVIDAKALSASPLAVRGGWAKRHAAGTATDVTSLPDGTKTILVASDLSPRTLDGSWRVGVIDLDKLVAVADLAARDGGRIDTVRNQPVVVTPRNMVLVPDGGTRVLARTPADRQEVGRWLAAAREKGPGPSAYLRSAAGADAMIVAALDLTDATDAASVRPRLDAAAAATGLSPADREGLARALAGMKGVTLTARVGEAIEAEIRLDFSEPVGRWKDVILPLFREALAAAGAELDDLAGWSARAEGTAAVLSGKLTEDSLHLAVSPFFAARALSSAHPGVPAAGGADAKLEASLRYFRGLTGIVDKLRKMSNLTVQSRVRWYIEYAHKIDDLPVLNVDPELLKLGTDIATTFRALSNAAGNFNNRGVIISQNRQSAAVPYVAGTAYGYGYNRYGNPVGFGYAATGTAVVNNNLEINNLLAVNAVTESALRADTWKNINTAMADARKKMTQKYQVEFPTTGDPPK
jgi:hypothetical protein